MKFLSVFATMICFFSLLIGSLSALAGPTCSNSLGVADSLSVDEIIAEPWVWIEIIRERQNGRAKTHPDDPYNFLMPEFQDVAGEMVKRLTKAVGKMWTSQTLKQRAIRQIKRLHRMLELGIPYYDFVAETKLFAKLMELHLLPKEEIAKLKAREVPTARSWRLLSLRPREKKLKRERFWTDENIAKNLVFPSFLKLSVYQQAKLLSFMTPVRLGSQPMLFTRGVTMGGNGELISPWIHYNWSLLLRQTIDQRSPEGSRRFSKEFFLAFDEQLNKLISSKTIIEFVVLAELVPFLFYVHATESFRTSEEILEQFSRYRRMGVSRPDLRIMDYVREANPHLNDFVLASKGQSYFLMIAHFLDRKMGTNWAERLEPDPKKRVGKTEEDWAADYSRMAYGVLGSIADKL